MGLTRPKYNNLDTSKFEIGDPITEINVNLADVNLNDTDIGFIFKRGSSGSNTALLWDKSEQEFSFIITTATGDSVGDLPITDYSNLHVKEIISTTIISNGITYPSSDGTTGQVMTTDGGGLITFQDIPIQVKSWGDITGTISNQTDLQTELDNKITIDVDDVDGGAF